MEESKSKKFLEFVKDEELITANFIENNVTIQDILMGVAATLKVVMEQTGKDQIEVFKVIGEMIDISEENKEEKGEKEDGGKQ